MRILRIDLSSQSYKVEEVNIDRKKFPGGKVLGLYLLAKNLDKDPIYITTGPLEGRYPGAARAGFHAISPHTGLVLDSYAGGTLGTYLSGRYDVIEITGSSEKPVYVVVGDEVEFHDASDLWGKGVYHTYNKLKDLGSVLAIGPAGENLVKYAVVMVDRDHAFGRAGSGYQFGKRKLKALVVRKPKGRRSKVYDKKLYQEVVKEISKRSLENKIFREYGTQSATTYAAMVGQIPVKNFYTTRHRKVDYLSGDNFKRYRIRSDRCLPCLIGCRKISNLDGIEVGGPEYETIAMTGADNLVFDPKSVIENGYLCNDLGLDTISTGNTMARYMEWLEKRGENRWGDHKFQVELIKKIAYRQDIGDILAEGVKRASEKLGGEEFAVHVKGLEAPARDPRGRLGAALSYATADVGASHLRGFPDREHPGKPIERRHVESLIKNRDRKATKDSLILCTFVPRDFELAKKAFYALTGEELDPLIGRRAENLARIINLRLKKDLKDEIPKRRREPVADGPAKGMKAFLNEEEFHKALRRFYELRLRDENGHPTEESLRRTSLDEFI